jgi:hypothetical protein
MWQQNLQLVVLQGDLIGELQGKRNGTRQRAEIAGKERVPMFGRVKQEESLVGTTLADPW